MNEYLERDYEEIALRKAIMVTTGGIDHTDITVEDQKAVKIDVRKLAMAYFVNYF